jgi:hypothetical protein
MSEPYWYPDTNLLTVCCSAVSACEVQGNVGLCHKCSEWSEMYDPEKDQEEEEKMATYNKRHRSTS